MGLTMLSETLALFPMSTSVTNEGRLLVAGRLEELDVLESLADRRQKTARIWLRLSPGIDVHTHAYVQTAHHASKFGIRWRMGRLPVRSGQAQKSRWLHLTGLHTHLGSQIFEIENRISVPLRYFAAWQSRKDSYPKSSAPVVGGEYLTFLNSRSIPLAKWLKRCARRW